MNKERHEEGTELEKVPFVRKRRVGWEIENSTSGREREREREREGGGRERERERERERVEMWQRIS